MSKTETLQQLAIEAGFPQDVQVTYHRGSRRWYLTYPLAMGTAATLDQPSTILGDYGSLKEAEEGMHEDSEQFWNQYGRVLALLSGDLTDLSAAEADLLLRAEPERGARMEPDEGYKRLLDEGFLTALRELDRTQLRYRLTSLGRRLLAEHKVGLLRRIGRQADRSEGAEGAEVTNKYHNVTYPALKALLQRVEAGDDIPDALLQQARRELAALETPQTTKGTYNSRYPDLPKQDIPWQQPDVRQSPLYTHEFSCAVCGRAVVIQNHSPRAPAICEREECRKTHTRLLARERKRRQRARQRRSQNDTKS